MRRVLAALVLCLGAIPCFAQFDMTSLSLMQASTSAAMNRADIRKELKLSREQDQAIMKIENGLSGTGRGRGKNDPNSLDLMGNYEQADKEIEALLDDKQKQRLIEIRIQIMGPPGFESPLVAVPLNLTDDQKEKVKSIEGAYQADLQSGLRGVRGRGAYDALVKKRAEADAKLLELLTDTQKAKYKEIQGAPFKNARNKSIF